VKIVGTIAVSCRKRVWSGQPGRKAGYVHYERSQPCHMRFFCHAIAWTGALLEMRWLVFSVSGQEGSVCATG